MEKGSSSGYLTMSGGTVAWRHLADGDDFTGSEERLRAADDARSRRKFRFEEFELLDGNDENRFQIGSQELHGGIDVVMTDLVHTVLSVEDDVGARDRERTQLRAVRVETRTGTGAWPSRSLIDH